MAEMTRAFSFRGDEVTMTRYEQLSTRQIRILNTLVQECDSDKIKILSGVRGSGKLRLLHRLQETLVVNGILPEQIIEIGVEYIRCDINDDGQHLHELIESQIGRHDQLYYVMINHVNFIDGWEQTLDQLRQKYRISFFRSRSYDTSVFFEVFFVSCKYKMKSSTTLSILLHPNSVSTYFS